MTTPRLYYTAVDWQITKEETTALLCTVKILFAPFLVGDLIGLVSGHFYDYEGSWNSCEADVEDEEDEDGSGEESASSSEEEQESEDEEILSDGDESDS